MKRINELNEREILALSNEDVKNLVKLEMANKGIKIVFKPIEPVKPKIKEDVKVYGLVGLDGIFFKDKTDAQFLSMLIKKGKMMRTTRNWTLDVTYIEDVKAECESSYYSYDVMEKTYPLKNSVDELYESLKSYQKKKEEYDKLMNEYSEYHKVMTNTFDDVISKVEIVRSKYARMERLRKIYKNEYLPLAGGSEDLAMSFFEKAYDPDEETLDYILRDDDYTDGKE